jgi:hypothetical protein
MKRRFEDLALHPNRPSTFVSVPSGEVVQVDLYSPQQEIQADLYPPHLQKVHLSGM